MVKTQELIVVEPGKIQLQARDLDATLAPHEVLVRTEHSIVSAGTEGAGFTGLVKEMPFGETGSYPRRTGYGNIGTVLDVGEAVTHCAPGDRVLTFAHHGSIVKADAARMALPLDRESPGKHLVFARMAGIGLAGLRASTVQAGDTVLVIGMGLVGNLAAQLFQLAGADVMVADLSPVRLEKARQCGLRRIVHVETDSLKDAVDEWTAGEGARAVVEAIGDSRVIDTAVQLTRKFGETILLGSPRAPAHFDVTPMLLRVHLEAIKVIGALEWRWLTGDPEQRRDLASNYRLIVEWIKTGSLSVEPLLTHVASPKDCQRIYEGLTRDKETYLSTVFDWSLL